VLAKVVGHQSVLRDSAVWAPAFAGATLTVSHVPHSTFPILKHTSPRSRGATTPGSYARQRPESIEGAGKTGCPPGTRGPRAKKVARVRGSNRCRRHHASLPCAVVLTVSSGLSSVNQLLPPSPARDLWSLARSLARAWARQDHTACSVRGDSRSSSAPPRPPHSTPTSVTIAIRPSIKGWNKTGTYSIVGSESRRESRQRLPADSLGSEFSLECVTGIQ
jgi:hypothetical protein